MYASKLTESEKEQNLDDSDDETLDLNSILREQGVTYDNLYELQKDILAENELEARKKEKRRLENNSKSLETEEALNPVNKRAEKSRLIKEAKLAMKSSQDSAVAYSHESNNVDFFAREEDTKIKKRSNSETSINRPKAKGQSYNNNKK